DENARAASDSELSERQPSEERVLPGLNLRSRLPVSSAVPSRSPMKRARQERLEELTREIDELLDSNDEDSDNEY
ncbi:hypothetical protein GGI05_004021, partial [Coemansia sp. RSA 2603]